VKEDESGRKVRCFLIHYLMKRRHHGYLISDSFTFLRIFWIFIVFPLFLFFPLSFHYVISPHLYLS
jgi:hypothetical protein